MQVLRIWPTISVGTNFYVDGILLRDKCAHFGKVALSEGHLPDNFKWILH